MKGQNILVITGVTVTLGISIFALWGVYDLRNKNDVSKEPSTSTDAPYIQTPVITEGYSPHLPTMQDVQMGMIVQEVQMPAGSMPGPLSSPLSATTTQFIGRGGVSDTSAQTPSDVIIAYSGNVLVYHNTTLEFEFGLPSSDKKLRLNDSGSYSRKSDALVWLWFTKNFDIATANFFVTPTAVSSVDELSFDYSFEGYPPYVGTLSRTATTVNGDPALEETVSYASGSPDYPNTWKFIHILRDGKLYTFGAQVAPVQAINEKEVEQMITVFKSSFRFLP